MPYEAIAVEQDGPALVVRFNRPEKRNAISVRMMGEIREVLESADADADVKGVIFTGGDKYFSSGMDLNDALVELGTPAQGIKFMNRWRALNYLMETNSKPIIAAVEGFCMTGGLELALACDLRVGSKSSSYALTSSKIGTVAGMGGTQRLPRIVGLANALDIMLVADPIDADTAFRFGLLNRLVPDGSALEQAKKLVGIFEHRAPLSLKLVKRVVYAGMQMGLNEAIEFEGFVVNTIYQTKDKQEGITAFLEKRTPKFKGE